MLTDLQLRTILRRCRHFEELSNTEFWEFVEQVWVEANAACYAQSEAPDTADEARVETSAETDLPF